MSRLANTTKKYKVLRLIRKHIFRYCFILSCKHFIRNLFATTYTDSLQTSIIFVSFFLIRANADQYIFKNIIEQSRKSYIMYLFSNVDTLSSTVL